MTGGTEKKLKGPGVSETTTRGERTAAMQRGTGGGAASASTRLDASVGRGPSRKPEHVAPAPHGAHVPAATEPEEPTPHPTHPSPNALSMRWPGHTMSTQSAADSAVATLLCVPGRHTYAIRRHAAADVCPAATVRRPLLHGVQYVAYGAPARVPNVSMGHVKQAVELSASLYCPAGQGVH